MVFNDLKKVAKQKIEAKYNHLLFKNGDGISFYYKTQSSSEMRIGCYILKYVDRFILKGFNAIIAYKEVEDIVLPILVNNSLIGSSALDNVSTITIDIQNKANVELHTSEPYLEVKSVEDINEFCKLLISFIDLDAMPFFSKWGNLTALYDFTKSLSDENLSDIMGVFYSFKLAAIKRLCNDCDYQHYMDNYYEQQKEYYNADPEDEDNLRYFNAARELKETLDNMKPKYFL